MSADFSNAYQDILFDNLVSIIKQNFIFQTQLKLVEKNNKDREDLQKKVEELTNLYNASKAEVSQLQPFKAKAEQNSSAHEEKSRIQVALNESMKKNSTLQKEIDTIKQEKNNEIQQLNNSIKQLKEYIEKLEENISVTKLKKINPEKVVSAEKTDKIVVNNLQKVLDGSSF